MQKRAFACIFLAASSASAQAYPPAPVPVTQAPTSPPEVSGAPGKGVTIRVDDAFSLNIRARFLLRYQWAALPEDATGDRAYESLFNISTARVVFSGHAYKPELLYLIQLAFAARDFRDGTSSPLFDAYLDWKANRDFNIKAGQYFVPFDRFRTVREFALQIGERSVPVTELTLDRDVGVTFYSQRFLGTPVGWHVGGFGGGGSNQITGKEPGGMLMGRVEVRPLGPIDDDSEGDLERRKVPGLAIGAGIASNWNTNRVRSTTGTTFKGGTTDYRHTAVDAVFKWRGLALQAEYVRRLASADTIRSVDDKGQPVTEYTRSAHGWITEASYTFDPPVQIVGRLSRLYTEGRTDPKLVSDVEKRGQEVAAGVNYFFNGHKLKLQLDWIGRMPTSFDLARADHLVHLGLDATL